MLGTAEPYTYVVVFSTEARSYTAMPRIQSTGPWLHDSRRFFTAHNDGQTFIVDRMTKDERPLSLPQTIDEVRYVAAVSPDDHDLLMFHAVSRSDIWIATLK